MITVTLLPSLTKQSARAMAPGVYICKSIVNYLRHGKYICKLPGRVMAPIGPSVSTGVWKNMETQWWSQLLCHSQVWIEVRDLVVVKSEFDQNDHSCCVTAKFGLRWETCGRIVIEKTWKPSDYHNVFRSRSRLCIPVEFTYVIQ
jgi:hypothetical protein